MRIQQLHYIIKIVETGSMNEAAKQLFITQPSLSNAVRDLENEDEENRGKELVQYWKKV